MLNNTHWSEELPLILLALRTTLKEDLKASLAELVYIQIFKLLRRFFEENKQLSEPLDLIKLLQSQIFKLAPIVYRG